MNREQRFGQRAWRMPNCRDLRSLQTKLPALPEQHPFIDVFNGWYWTSTTAAISPVHAWYVARWRACVLRRQGSILHAMADTRRRSGCRPAHGPKPVLAAAGKVNSCSGSGQDGEWRVGAPWPEPRFETLQTGVLDRLTRLLWCRRANLTLQPVLWGEALAAVAEFNQDGEGSASGGCPRSTTGSLGGLRHSQPGLAVRTSFRDVQDIYCSSTTSLFEPDWASR